MSHTLKHKLCDFVDLFVFKHDILCKPLKYFDPISIVFKLLLKPVFSKGLPKLHVFGRGPKSQNLVPATPQKQMFELKKVAFVKKKKKISKHSLKKETKIMISQK